MVYWDWRTAFTRQPSKYISANNWRELLRMSTIKGFRTSYYSLVQWRPLDPRQYYFEEWPSADFVTPIPVTLDRYRKAFGYYTHFHGHLGLYETRTGYGSLIRYNIDHGFWEYTGHSIRDNRSFCYDISSFTPGTNMAFCKAPRLTEGLTNNETIGIFDLP